MALDFKLMGNPGFDDGLPVGADGRYMAIAALTDHVIYVSTSGSNTNSGRSPGKAKLTVQAGLNALASGGILVIASGIYDSPAGSYFDLANLSNIVITGNGPSTILRLPADTRTGSQHLLNLANQSHVTICDLQFYAPYTHTCDLILMGSGTLTDCLFERVLFKLDTWDGVGSQSYFANMTSTATRGISGLGFKNCRFEALGTAQVSGLLIRGFAELDVVSCRFINVNNPIVPDTLFQKYGLTYVDNDEVYTVDGINIEGPDVTGVNGVVWHDCRQRATVAITATTDVGGGLLDTGGGFGCDTFDIHDNLFFQTPLLVVPRTGAGNSISNGRIHDNQFDSRRTLAGVNNGIVLTNDPKADGTTHDIYIHDNSIYGTYTGRAIANESNAFPPTGYTNLVVKDNAGFNPQGVASAIVVGASPFTYTNNDCVPELVYIFGGTVSRVDVGRNGVASAQIADSSGVQVWLEPLDSVFVYHTGAPTMIKDRK